MHNSLDEHCCLCFYFVLSLWINDNAFAVFEKPLEYYDCLRDSNKLGSSRSMKQYPLVPLLYLRSSIVKLDLISLINELFSEPLRVHEKLVLIRNIYAKLLIVKHKHLVFDIFVLDSLNLMDLSLQVG